MPAIARSLRLQALRLAGLALSTRAALPPARVGSPRILLIQPDHLGDVLLASPALQVLVDALPNAQFTYLVGPWSADAARHGPLGGCVQSLAFPGFTREKTSPSLAPYRLLAAEARRLRPSGFDAALVLRPDHWWGALLAKAAGIGYRAGYSVPETVPLLTHALPYSSTRHATNLALALVEEFLTRLGNGPAAASECQPIFHLAEEDRAEADRILKPHVAQRAPLVVIHPSAGARLKSWPPSRWVAVADGLHQQGLTVLITGGPGDEPLVRGVAQATRATPAPAFVGQRLGVTGGLFARCQLVLGPDGGALHLAAAVGTPTLRLYGPADPARFGPWQEGGPQRVLIARTLQCTPCGMLVHPPCRAVDQPACMRSLSVDEVLETALTLLPQGSRHWQAGV